MPGVDGEQNGSNGSTEQLVLPQLGRHAQEDTTPLASMPLHAILPRPQPDKSFNHHKTAHGKKYMSKSRQKPKSIWYLDDIKAKKKNAATSRGKAKGNEWIRQKHTSRSSKHGGKGGKKKALRRKSRSDQMDVQTLPSASDREEQRRLERMPWRYQSGRARRRSLLNPHKRIIGLWDPAADVHSQYMEPMRKSAVLKEHEAKSPSATSPSGARRVINTKARSWLASRSNLQDARVEIGPVITTQSKIEEEEEANGVGMGLTITDFVAPLTKHQNQVEVREAKKYLEAKLRPSKKITERSRSGSAELLEELQELQRKQEEKRRENMAKLANAGDELPDGDDDAVEEESTAASNKKEASDQAASGSGDYGDDYGDDDDYDDDYSAAASPTANSTAASPTSNTPAAQNANSSQEETKDSEPAQASTSGQAESKDGGSDDKGDDDYGDDDYGDDDDYDDDYSDE